MSINETEITSPLRALAVFDSNVKTKLSTVLSTLGQKVLLADTAMDANYNPFVPFRFKVKEDKLYYFEATFFGSFAASGVHEFSLGSAGFLDSALVKAQAAYTDAVGVTLTTTPGALSGGRVGFAFTAGLEDVKRIVFSGTFQPIEAAIMQWEGASDSIASLSAGSSCTVYELNPNSGAIL